MNMVQRSYFHQFILFMMLLPCVSLGQNIDSLNTVLKKAPDKAKAKVYYELSEALRVNGDLAQSLQNGKKSFEYAKKFDDKSQMASALTGIGLSQFYLGKAVPALASFVEAKKLYLELNNKSELANITRNIGVAYKTISKYDDAVKNYQEAVALFEQTKDLESAAQCMMNIGNVYIAMKNVDKSFEFYHEALKVFEKLNSSYYTVLVLNSIGAAYIEKKNGTKALEIFQKALATIPDSTYVISTAKTLLNISVAYRIMGQYKKAIVNCTKAKEMFTKQQNNVDLAMTYKTFGDIYKNSDQSELALQNYLKAAEMMKSQDMLTELPSVYKDISLIYQQNGNYVKALETYKSYSDIKDSTLKLSTQQNTEELNFRFDTEKKDLKFKEQSAKLRQSQILIYSVVILAVFILLLLFLAYNRYLIKKKANSELSQMNEAITLKNFEITEKNAEIIAQNEELERQKSVVEKQKEEILSSIHYASRIQKAILPPKESFNEYLPDHFILNKPRDIVSGDFYWLLNKDNKTIIAVADCTGHGVPGAFMSMLGISFLNEIANNAQANTSNQILNLLREYVMTSLRQTGKENEAKDGMDISLAIIDRANKTIQFSGAYNPLYLLDENKLTTIKGDRMPIGIYFGGQKEFSMAEVSYTEGNKIYLCSDGYEDQFGGDHGRKFMAKRFQELLVSISDKEMSEQQQLLDQAIIEWKGEREQVDDILVVGIKL